MAKSKEQSDRVQSNKSKPTTFPQIMQNNLKRIAITVGIAIVLSVLVPLITDYLYKAPEYNQFCDESIYPRYKTYPVTASVPKEGVCNYNYESNPEYSNCTRSGMTPIFEYNESGCQVYKSCSDCNKRFDKANEKYNLNIILITTPVALVAVMLGLYLAIDFIGAGFMFGGIILLIYASARSFGTTDKLVSIGLLIIDLLVLLWIGFKKLK